MEPVTTSSQLLLWEAIDQVREAEDGTDLSLDELAECVMAALGSSLSLQQICRAADGLLHLADEPSQGSTSRQCPATMKLAGRFASLIVTTNWCRDRFARFLCLRLLSG